MGFLEGVMNARGSQTECRVHPPRGPYVDIVLIFHKDSTISYVGESPNMYVGRPKHPLKFIIFLRRRHHSCSVRFKTNGTRIKKRFEMF